MNVKTIFGRVCRRKCLKMNEKILCPIIAIFDVEQSKLTFIVLAINFDKFFGIDC